jgi:hypothetical protein
MMNIVPRHDSGPLTSQYDSEMINTVCSESKNIQRSFMLCNSGRNSFWFPNAKITKSKLLINSKAKLHKSSSYNSIIESWSFFLCLCLCLRLKKILKVL